MNVLILLVDGCPRIDSSLNPSKTELIWFYSGRRQLSFVENDIVLLGNRIAPVHIIRYLGVMLDSNMTMSQHVLRVCKNCYFQLRLIRRLGKALSVESKLFLGACIGS